MGDTRLLVRADDAGSSWASNVGCLKASTEGIARSVEVMMPCGWVAHAVQLLNAHPAIDVGIHLTVTSEWDAVKWRPLTEARSLIDDNGYFHPLLTPRDGDSRTSLLESCWALDDFAGEFRAQIERGLAAFPNVSHISSHMIPHFGEFDPTVGALVSELCTASGLKDLPWDGTVSRMDGYPKHPRNPAARIESLVGELRSLQPGTYVFVDHPAVDGPELAAMGHDGYEDVQADRTSCLDVWTSRRVRDQIAESEIELISYRDL